MENYNSADIAKLVAAVISEMNIAPASTGMDFPVETSARHVHLTKQAVEALFGPGYQLTKKKDLSQPGQFASNEKVKIVTPKGELAGVSVLGPERPEIQVELSATDARTLGIKAPLRISGDLSGAADVVLIGPCGMIEAKGSAIVAKAHIHMLPSDAARFGVSDGQTVSVRVNSERSITYENVAVRLTNSSGLAMHIDTDEANAGMVPTNARGYIINDGNRSFVPNNGGGSCSGGCCGGCCGGSHHEEVKPVAKFERIDNKSRFLGHNEKTLITEMVAKQMLAHGETVIEIPKNAIVTPGAKDIFIREKVTLNYQR